MKKNKKNKVITLSIIILILSISAIIFILNFAKDETSFTILEKSWISSNANNVIDVSIYNDVPVYGMNGKGISFSFLDEFTEKYGIQFNKLSYLNGNASNLKKISFKVLNYDVNISDNDIEIFDDYYVIVSKEGNQINNLNDFDNTTMGVLDKDASSVRYYLGDSKNVSFVTSSDISGLINNINDDSVKYLALPKNMYLDDILENNLNIVYHISELYNKYVISVENDNTLKSIIKKYWLLFKKNSYNEHYKKNLMEAVFAGKKINDVEKMNYNSNSYVYGYVTNIPYEGVINKEYVGIFSNYLSEFEDLADVDFKIVGYNSVNELKQALSHGEVDVSFANFNVDNVNIDTLYTISPYSEEYVVISKNNLVVNSIRSLKQYEVLTVNDTYLYNYLTSNNVKVKGYSNTDDLLRNMRDESILLVDKGTYEYYKDNKFKGYLILNSGKINEEYRFVIRDVSKNNTFYKLFSFYISNLNYKEIQFDYNTNYIINSRKELSTMLKYLIIILIITFAVLLLLGLILKKKNKNTELDKIDKLKFTDVMTSLKNRNYLNYNIKKWEENVIYPQSIVIIDLNNIKYINDNYGHEEGDNVIKAAANILINNQIENTDIMRTDGNEFLIYMIGYEEKKVQEHIRKLNKSLKELPHDFGATIGYSMIVDDVKTIDDAINEATLAMRAAKDKI